MTLQRRLRAGLQWVFLLAAAVVIALTVKRQGAGLATAVTRIGTDPALAALAAVLVGLFASAMTWRSLLADLGSPLPLRAALHVFFLGQLGKYLPGSVFAVGAQMELGRRQGLSRSRVGTASVLFMGVLVVTGLLVAAVALPLTSPESLRRYFWAWGVLPVGLVCLAPPLLSRLVGGLLHLLRRQPLDRSLSWKGVGTAACWALATWAAYGAHLLLLVLPSHPAGSTSVPLLAVGAYALAWTVGFLFLLAPAGALLREAVLVLTLAPALPGSAATAVAVLSRAVMTFADLAWGGVAAALGPGRRRKPPQVPEMWLQ